MENMFQNHPSYSYHKRQRNWGIYILTSQSLWLTAAWGTVYLSEFSSCCWQNSPPPPLQDGVERCRCGPLKFPRQNSWISQPRQYGWEHNGLYYRSHDPSGASLCYVYSYLYVFFLRFQRYFAVFKITPFETLLIFRCSKRNQRRKRNSGF